MRKLHWVAQVELIVLSCMSCFQQGCLIGQILIDTIVYDIDILLNTPGTIEILISNFFLLPISLLILIYFQILFWHWYFQKLQCFQLSLASSSATWLSCSSFNTFPLRPESASPPILTLDNLSSSLEQNILEWIGYFKNKNLKKYWINYL